MTAPATESLGALALSLGPAEGEVDVDAPYAYARATNDDNPVYERGESVPPLYTVSLVFPQFRAAHLHFVDALGNTRGGVHGLHDVYYHRPVRPGMRLRWTAVTNSAEQTKAGTRVTLRFLITDEHDVPVVEHYWSNLYFGTSIPEPLGQPLADHAFPEDARSRPVGERTFTVARDQTFRYAGASGDNGDMHVSDEAARGYGLPAKILQGLCTFAMCSAAVVDGVAEGDPDRLRRLACRFSATTVPGNDVAVALYDAGEAAGGARAVAFEAISAGEAVIKHGRAEVR